METPVYSGFEDYLFDQFFYSEHPTDDSCVEAFDEWLTRQDVYDLIKYADDYTKSKLD